MHCIILQINKVVLAFYSHVNTTKFTYECVFVMCASVLVLMIDVIIIMNNCL